MTERKLLFPDSLLLLALAPVYALAADVKAQTSARYPWYDDPSLEETTGDLLQCVKTSPSAYPCFTNITTAAELRASSNRRFESGDPGADEHNYRHAAELLYDSLDELDDGSLNGSGPFSGKTAFRR